MGFAPVIIRPEVCYEEEEFTEFHEIALRLRSAEYQKS
jgi:hypothetical protein